MGKNNLKPVVFLDRDGTLVHDRPGFYLTHPQRMKMYKTTVPALRLLQRHGFDLVILTNQAGIARKTLSLQTLKAIHKSLLKRLGRRGIKIRRIYFCPHAPEENCPCRKPKTLLAEKAARELGLSLGLAWMVGDKKTDMELAKNMKIPSVFLLTGHGKNEIRLHGSKIQAVKKAKNLLEAAKWILKATSLKLLAVPILCSSLFALGTSLAAQEPSTATQAGSVLSTAPANGQTAAPESVPSAVSQSTQAAASETVPTPATPSALSDWIEPARLDLSQIGVDWFPEKLEYEVHWGLLNVGAAHLTSTDAAKVRGRPAYHIVSEAISNNFIDAFHKVRDRNESWMDVETLASFGYLKKQREGGFFRDEWVLFDWGLKKFFANITNKSGEVSRKEGPIPDMVHDVLSSMYYIRCQNLEVGKEYSVAVNTKQTWLLTVKVLKKEKVKTVFGKKECFLVEPFLQEGLFIQKGKKLQIWMTADERKIPVKMKAEVIIGHISADLVKATYNGIILKEQ